MVKKLGKDLIIIYILTFIASIFGYLIRILFSRKLTVTQYGLFYSVFALVFFFMPIRDLGLTKASVYYINKFFAEKKEHLVKTVMLIGLIPQIILGFIIAIAIYLLRNFLANSYFKNAEAIPLIIIFSIYFAVETFLPTIFNLFAITQNYVLMQILNPIKTFLILTFSLLFFRLGYTYLTPALAYLFTFIVVLIIFGFVFLRKYKKLLSYKFVKDKILAKKMFFYGLPLVFSGAANNLLAYSDVLLLTFFSGLKITGYYNIALPTLSMVLILIGPINSLLFPVISRAWHRKNHKDISKILSIIFNHILFFSLPFALIFFTFPKTIISIIFDAKYIPAYPAVQILAVFFVFQATRMLSFSALAGLGMPKQESKILLIGGSANLILDLILIPFFSISGAAFATGIGHLIMASMALKTLYSKVKFKIIVSDQVKSVFAGTLMLGSIFVLKYFIHLQILPELILISIISGLVYLLSCILFGIITKEKIINAKTLLFG